MPVKLPDSSVGSGSGENKDKDKEKKTEAKKAYQDKPKSK